MIRLPGPEVGLSTATSSPETFDDRGGIWKLRRAVGARVECQNVTV